MRQQGSANPARRQCESPLGRPESVASATFARSVKSYQLEDAATAVPPVQTLS